MSMVTTDERIADALERIADALERAVPEPTVYGPCEHPRDQREDAGSTMGHLRWRCACGYVHDEAIGQGRH